MRKLLFYLSVLVLVAASSVYVLLVNQTTEFVPREKAAAGVLPP